jgi:FtsZ-binding cell division protein ZapB
MSLSRAELEAMDRGELVTAVVRLSETVQNLQAEVEVLKEKQTRASDVRTDMWDRIEALEDDSPADPGDQDSATSDDIEDLHRERMKLARRLTAVEEELEIDATTANRAAEGRDTSPLYLLERVGPEAVADHPGATLQRARELLENRERWGEVRTNMKYGRHRVLASAAHDLRTRLEDARSENLQWRQVYVAMDKIASLGGDHVTFDEAYGDDYGKAIVWQEVAEG